MSLKDPFQVVLIQDKLTHLYKTIPSFPFEQLSSVLDAEQVTFNYRGGLAWAVNVDLAA